VTAGLAVEVWKLVTGGSGQLLAALSVLVVVIVLRGPSGSSSRTASAAGEETSLW
jgi:hypothetical protein